MPHNLSHRYLFNPIAQDALVKKKIVFLSGPRQVGKTTLAKQFLADQRNYFSYDNESFRRNWVKNPQDALTFRGRGVVALDEIHKDRYWKRKLKGIYDSAERPFPIIVTGSARLDLYRKGSDSLLGRYLPYRLHPLSVAERENPSTPDEILKVSQVRFPLNQLMATGGFPEPFFEGNTLQATRWSRLRLERLVQEDTRDLLAISDLRAFQILAELLPERVGSALSINSLREDIGKAYATVRSWYYVLESLFFSFTVRPYSKRIARAIRAEPKMYLYDILRIPANLRAKRLENITALHLLKACDYWNDTAQGEFSLHFVRDKQKREVDFLIVRDGRPWLLVECKSGSTTPSPHLVYFGELLKPQHQIQLVEQQKFDREFPSYGVRVMNYEKFFAGLI